MRLGILGGTFDPPHVGHLIVADDAAAALALERVAFVPTGTHPLKGTSVEAPADLRVQMTEAATAGSPLFVVDDCEIRRPGPSYTADTIRELQVENPDAELYLLVGSDILGELHQWHRMEEIADRATIVVLGRADAPADTYPEDIEMLTIEVTHVAVSSSEIRERIKRGRPFRYLVPDPVYELIVEHSLYREPDNRPVHT